MRGIACALALAFLAACGGREPAEPDDGKIDMVLAAPPRPEPVPVTVAWKPCAPGYDGVGNKWWGGFVACEGELEVDVEADSINLGGPAVRIMVHTRSCPAGAGVGGASFDRSVFDRPFEAQLAEAKRMVSRSLAKIDEKCGGPVRAPGQLGRRFDEEFRNLADRYWLGLSAADRRRSWRS